MKVTRLTPSNLIETYEVDLPAAATDAEVLAATEELAPVASHRELGGLPSITWREHDGLDAVAAELAASKAAFERATEQAKAAIEAAAAEGMGERAIADKFGVDRTTIRRWRGK